MSEVIANPTEEQISALREYVAGQFAALSTVEEVPTELLNRQTEALSALKASHKEAMKALKAEHRAERNAAAGGDESRIAANVYQAVAQFSPRNAKGPFTVNGEKVFIARSKDKSTGEFSYSFRKPRPEKANAFSLGAITTDTDDE